MSDAHMPEADMVRAANPVDSGASPDMRSIQIKALEGKIRTLKRQVTLTERAAREKNLALDALHYVWCTGGCKSGQHRWCQGEVTEAMMLEAAQQMKRMRLRYNNMKFRALPSQVQSEWFKSETFKTGGDFGKWLSDSGGPQA